MMNQLILLCRTWGKLFCLITLLANSSSTYAQTSKDLTESIKNGQELEDFTHENGQELEDFTYENSDELEDFIYESGPYPRLLTLSIPEQLPKKDNEWKLKIVETLEKEGLAVIDRNTVDKLHWHPANEDDSNVRTNYDRNYEKLDYSVVLGSIDVEILSTSTSSPAKKDAGDAKAKASLSAKSKLRETLEPSPLYDKLLPLLPEKIRQSFIAKEKTINFQIKDGEFTLRSIE
jgi:hypothetical protein